ncbi:MAG TPA: hypothetical protein VLV89_11575, partial [Candidatus Acidoferrum sp.]|nr:hypothetical protein [Candidatus Acidoferrum sp.]
MKSNSIVPSRHFRFLSEKTSLAFCFAAITFIASAFVPGASAQDWFKTGTGLGVQKARVAVADFASHAAGGAGMQPFAKEFGDVVRGDLDYSGIVDIVSPSMYPTQVPSQPSELNAQAWSDAPASSQFLAFGNLSVTGSA